MSVTVPIKLYLFKQEEGRIWLLGHSVPTSDLDNNFSLLSRILLRCHMFEKLKISFLNFYFHKFIILLTINLFVEEKTLRGLEGIFEKSYDSATHNKHC